MGCGVGGGKNNAEVFLVSWLLYHHIAFRTYLFNRVCREVGFCHFTNISFYDL